MSDISEPLLDALIEFVGVQSVWLKPNKRRGSHFSRADEDLFVCAPSMDEAGWERVLSLVSRHEKWHLISVFRVVEVPVEGAKKVRPRAD